jgi:lipoprotein-anchoring transpeptidase ErfK/SrfK
VRNTDPETFISVRNLRMKKRYWVAAVATLSVAGVAAITVPESPINAVEETAVASVSLQVDLSARELHVLEGGEVVQSYPVAIGKPSYPTPKGTFNIRRIIWNPRWVPPDSKWAKNKKPKGPGEPGNPMGRVKIFFSEPDYYIHGTREVDSLGQAESHGCVRMRNADVIALAKTVMAAGGKPVQPSFVRRVINRVRSTQEVRLSTPVRITVKS